VLPGVSDGTRTRDVLDHNQVLYQLSYTHHATGRPRLRGRVYPDRSATRAAQLSAVAMYLAAMVRAVSVSGPGCGTKRASR
jgi:hypothetical protein